VTLVAALVITGCAGAPAGPAPGAHGAGDPAVPVAETPPADVPAAEAPPVVPDVAGPAAPAGSPAASLPEGDDTTVTSVTDGDTIVVADGTRVRLIGVDTPESTTARYGHVECYGAEATAYLRERLAPGTEVRLVADAERLDRYGRTLAYVYRRADGWFANLALAEDGYAQVLTIPPNVAHAEEFRVAVARARAAERGLWGGCADDSAPAPPATASAAAGGCDAAYPDVCIPPGPPAGPDLNCSAISHRRFTVLPPDPHNFDGNGDGVGCESA
jgi:micrococcal nuclease